MVWVLWDLLVPMLVTFVIGLGTGWMLWRWRRQRQLANALLSRQQGIADLAGSSANVVLIEERDQALARAEQAESELESQKLGIPSSSDSLSHGAQGDVQNDADSHKLSDKTVLSNNDASNSAELDALTEELDKEKASKVELEQALASLNSRYTVLSATLEEVVSAEDAAQVKDTALLQSNYEQSLQKISKQDAALQKLVDKEQATEKAHAAEIADKESELAQVQIEKEEIAAALQSQKKLAAELAVKESLTAQPDATEAKSISSNVSNLSGYSTDADRQAGSHNSVSSAQPQSMPEQTLAKSEQTQGKPEQTQERLEPAGRAQQSQSDVTKAELLPSEAEVLDNQPELIEDKLELAKDKTEVTKVNSDVLSSNVAQSQPTANDMQKSQSVDVDGPSTKTGQVSQPTASVEVSTASSAGADATGVSRQNVTCINAAKKAGNKKPPPSRPARSKKSAYVPEAWDVPEKPPKKAERDDLQAIKGVGPVLEKMLHKTGIYYYGQIASLNKKGIAELDGQIPQFAGRIERDEWVSQAKKLNRAKAK